MVVVKHGSRSAARSAFTLLEVLIVVAILVILAGVGGVQLMKFLEEARIDKAKIDVKTLSDVVQAYQVKHGGPPQSLAILLQPDGDGGRPYLESADILRDPWGGAYMYDAGGGRNNGLKPDIYTTAPNGTVVGNWSS